MLPAVILSLLLSQAIEGRRIGTMRKYDIRHSGPEEEEGKCLAACGAESLTVDNINFVIGSWYGKPVEKRKDSECLADCFVGREGESCGFFYSKMSKLKGREKLCCKIKPCTWRVQLDNGLVGKWEQQLDGETRLFPLQDFKGGEITRNSCFCCSEAGLPWNGLVNQKCKLGYGNTGSFLPGAVAVLTFSLSDKVWKQNCESYCLHFAGYKHAKKNFRPKVWVPGEIPKTVDGPALAAELELDLEESRRAVERELEQFESLGTVIDLEKQLHVSEDLRELLERAEASEVKEHIDTALLEEARNTLKALDEKTMPAQLENAIEKIEAASGLDPNDDEQNEELLKTFEEIEAVISKASDYVKETENALESLEKASEMLAELAKKKQIGE